MIVQSWVNKKKSSLTFVLSWRFGGWLQIFYITLGVGVFILLDSLGSYVVDMLEKWEANQLISSIRDFLPR